LDDIFIGTTTVDVAREINLWADRFDVTAIAELTDKITVLVFETIALTVDDIECDTDFEIARTNAGAIKEVAEIDFDIAFESDDEVVAATEIMRPFAFSAD
jgi:hypothetical protein